MAEEIIGGYRLQNLMMTGQTSQVWEVVELASHRHFAMKLLLPEKAREQAHRRHIMHEASVGKKLAHPNIIKIFHIDRNPKNPHFVMEFFPAGSLKLRLIRKQTDFINQHLPKILQKSATALAYMNASGWVHRDVKPDNILVNAAAEVRLIDFALAKRVEKPKLFDKIFRRKRLTQGTRSYMSPEQILGQPLDGRADIYSFGASAYELVTGRPPFRAATSQQLLSKHITDTPASPKTFNDEVTDEFAQLLLRLLAKNRKDRPRDFHEVLMKLRSMRLLKSQEVSEEEEMGM